MGLFGNISESLNNLSNAIEQLVYHPINDENIVKGTFYGLALFMKQATSAVIGPVNSIFQTVGTGFNFFV